MFIPFDEIFGLFVFVFMGSRISFYSRKKYFNGDAAIVLGNSIKNGEPSSVFKERINHAIKLYKENRITYIIFTGGPVKGEYTTEAEAAKRYAIQNGVKEKHILLENHSRITYENLAFAKQIIEKFNFQDVLIISDPYHMRRAISMAKDLKMEVHPSPTPTTKYQTFWQKLGFLSREIPATLLYLYSRPLRKIIKKIHLKIS